GTGFGRKEPDDDQTRVVSAMVCPLIRPVATLPCFSRAAVVVRLQRTQSDRAYAARTGGTGYRTMVGARNAYPRTNGGPHAIGYLPDYLALWLAYASRDRKAGFP